MKKQRILTLCLASLLALSLAACNSQAGEQDSTPPTASVQPTIKPTPTPEPTPPIPYTDVAEDSPYYDVVVWAYENGIASDGETFEPLSASTRGQVMTFLWRAKGSPEPQTIESPFSDVSSADWFYKPALWAYENGIATSTTFKPNSSCTNSEAITFLYRAEGKPAAAVYSSPMALAASGTYYERPVAWAENSGMFAGLDSAFDPSAPCTRAGLMSYLYWLTEEWAFTEEDKTVQAEYEQIINDAQLYEVHGSGLCYADYVDVDGDGKVELLTVDSGEDLSIVNNMHAYDVTATVYASVDGHAVKICEQAVTFSSGEDSLYVCTYDGHMCLHHSMFLSGAGYYDDFYKIENGTFVVSDSVSEEFTFTERGNVFFSHENAVSESEYNAIIEKYTDGKNLFYFDRFKGISVKDRGLLPTAEEYYNKWVYPAVLNGDFSFFAGTYRDSWGRTSLVLDKNGGVTSDGQYDYINQSQPQEPISITITDGGVIHCEIIPVTIEALEFPLEGSTWSGAEFDICPIGVEFEPIGQYSGVELDSGKLRIMYTEWGGTAGAYTEEYYKVS